MSQKNIIVYIHTMPPGAAVAVKKLSKENGKRYRTMLIRDNRSKGEDVSSADLLVECDFSKPWKIAEALLPYQEEFRAICCRSESNINRFAAVIPHVPYLRTPTTESLRWATDKYEMRKRFKLFDPKNTPKFTWVKENTKKERKRTVEKVGFPMIVKPTNLAQSTLVSICYHEEELEKTLRNAFRKIRKEYKDIESSNLPRIIAEEFIEGDMYSIDSYVNSLGEIYHCPMVQVVTGKNIGHDDFYNYLRISPTKLKKSTIEKAQTSVERGVHALGLRNTTIHAELIRVDDEWRIVEIAPRIGGFRHVIHSLSCDIDHSLNDILIRLPRKPIIPKKCKGYAAVMRYYPEREGKVVSMSGIKKIKEVKSFHEIKVKLKVGDRCYFAKNGGKGMFDLTLFNKDRSKLLADIRRIEKTVKISIK